MAKLSQPLLKKTPLSYKKSESKADKRYELLEHFYLWNFLHENLIHCQREIPFFVGKKLMTLLS